MSEGVLHPAYNELVLTESFSIVSKETTGRIIATVNHGLGRNEIEQQALFAPELVRRYNEFNALESQLSLYKQKCELQENVIRASAQYKISKSVVIKINLTKATEALNTFNEQNKEIK